LALIEGPNVTSSGHTAPSPQIERRALNIAIITIAACGWQHTQPQRNSFLCGKQPEVLEDNGFRMVLLVRIEFTTSPLPTEFSKTKMPYFPTALD
jgi:hypothetical protein